MTDSVAAADLALALAAYAGLTERSRAVLWHAVLEHEPPSEVAAIVGAVVDEVPGLIDSARRELCAALVRRYVETARDETCCRVLPRLPDLRDRGLTTVGGRAVESHVATCDHCAGAQRWINDVALLMERAVLPSVLGSEAAARYLDDRTD